MADYWANLRALLHMPPRPSDKADYVFIGEDAGGFLATFSIALSMIVIAYVLLYFLTL